MWRCDSDFRLYITQIVGIMDGWVYIVLSQYIVIKDVWKIFGCERKEKNIEKTQWTCNNLLQFNNNFLYFISITIAGFIFFFLSFFYMFCHINSSKGYCIIFSMTKRKKNENKYRKQMFFCYIIKKENKGTMATPDVHKKKIIGT